VNYEKILGNIQEVRARGGRVIAIHSEGDTKVPTLAEAAIPCPQTNPLLMPIVSVIPTQLFSYHVADHRGPTSTSPKPRQVCNGRIRLQINRQARGARRGFILEVFATLRCPLSIAGR